MLIGCDACRVPTNELGRLVIGRMPPEGADGSCPAVGGVQTQALVWALVDQPVVGL